MVHKPDPSGNKKEGFGWNRGSFANIADAVDAITEWDAEPTTTVYFSIGAFANNRTTKANGKEKIERKQVQATVFKTLAVDLDIGADKPYATQSEGWKIMNAALQNIGMPSPMVVSSGNGIHLYWPLTAPIAKDDWVAVSTALRLALEEENVVIDTTKIHDPSMVLRPAGTHHKKQTPWKKVTVKLDCPDYEYDDIKAVLSKWMSQVAPSRKRTSKAKAGKSSILDAVLTTNDVLLDEVAKRCKQIQGLIDSGGVTDIKGNRVEEPMWRASLGIAKYTTDPEQSIILMAGKHDEFDLDASMAKMSNWKGTGPTTCATFEKLCSGGCSGCPHKGKLTSPTQLSMVDETEVVKADGSIESYALPPGYHVRSNSIYRERLVPSVEIGPNGEEIQSESVEFELVSAYQAHITGVYYDEDSKHSAFKLAVKYPMTGWKEHESDIAIIAVAGKDFSSFLLNKQIFIKGTAQQERLRGYLMDYLTMVQQSAPTGVDYTNFGWQKDGSFLCGEMVLNSPDGEIATRLRSPANRYKDIVGKHGSRSEFIRAMNMLNMEGTDTLRASVLIGTTGILANAAGNGTLLYSVYSPKSSTGKTLALAAINSLVGSPKPLMYSQRDTNNAMFKLRGILNNLPFSIDEVTTGSPDELTENCYFLSSGKEKESLTQTRDLRTPAMWAGPTCVTTNESLYDKYSIARSNDEALRVRTLEIHHHDRRFVTPEKGSNTSPGSEFFEILESNNGHAFPELVEAVVAMGGPKAVWTKGLASFDRSFNFQFLPQERYYRTTIIAGWILGRIGKQLGLFPFDVERTVQFLLDLVKSLRNKAKIEHKDAFDIIGEFLAKNNDKLLEVTMQPGGTKEQVREPAPERAVARVKIVTDNTTPVMPGSVVYISHAEFRMWLAHTKDSVDRIVSELREEGALVAERERVTMFKGCKGRNPAQTHCITVDLSHPRFVDALTGTTSSSQSKILLAVLNGDNQ